MNTQHTPWYTTDHEALHAECLRLRLALGEISAVCAPALPDCTDEDAAERLAYRCEVMGKIARAALATAGA